MDARTNLSFIEAVSAAITSCQLERYFVFPESGLENVERIEEINLNVDVLSQDFESAGGLKVSRGQRAMLMVLTVLWRPKVANKVFGYRVGELADAIMSMDRYNRRILTELIESYVGWAD